MIFIEHITLLIYRLNIFNFLKQQQQQKIFKKTPRNQGVTSLLATPCHCSATASSPVHWCFSVTDFSGTHQTQPACFPGLQYFWTAPLPYQGMIWLLSLSPRCTFNPLQANSRPVPQMSTSVCDCDSFKYCLWYFIGLCRDHIFLAILKYWRF